MAMFATRTSPRASRRSGGARPRIVFVCTANISRSAYAELRLRHLLGEQTQWTIRSAGIPGTDGREMDPMMAQLAVARGVSAEETQYFRSTSLSPRVRRHASMIVTMTADHRSRLLDEYPDALNDVWTIDQWAQAAQLLQERGIVMNSTSGTSTRALIEQWNSVRGYVRHRHDVDDPFRRGEQAALTAANSIDAFLDTVCPVLMTHYP